MPAPRFGWITGVLGASLIVLGFAPGLVFPAVAEPATPVASPAPAAECTVAPRPVDEILEIARTNRVAARATPTPADDRDWLPAGLGEPADPATAAAATAFFREWEACTRAGDELRVISLVDPALYTFNNSKDAREFLEHLAATPPEPRDFGRMVGPWNIRLLPDGRVIFAFAVENKDKACLDPSPDVMILVNRDGRWFMDQVPELLWIVGQDSPQPALDLFGPPPAEMLAGVPPVCVPSPEQQERQRQREERRANRDHAAKPGEGKAKGEHDHALPDATPAVPATPAASNETGIALDHGQRLTA